MRKKRLIFLGSASIFVLYLFIILPAEAGRFDTPLPDTLLFYSANELQLISDALGSQGRALYIETRVTFDILWPLAYTFFLLSSYDLVSLKSHFWLPLLGMCADFVENISVSLYFWTHPNSSALLGWLASLATFVKWGSLALSFIVLLIGIALKITKSPSKG